MVDPYNFNKKFDMGFLKKDIAEARFDRLWKVGNFDLDADTIVLGDSRSKALLDDFFKQYNKNSYNFSFVGSSLYEQIDAFWYTVEKSEKVKQIIMGVPFTMFNKNKKHNMLTSAFNLYENRCYYYINLDIFKTSLKVMFNKEKELKPYKDDRYDDFIWKVILDDNFKKDFNNYEYPSNLILELKKIVEYCKVQNIELIFFAAPSHMDLQLKITKELSDEYKRYKDFMCSLQNSYFFEYENSITLNKENYIDPYHFNRSIAKIIVDELLNKKSIISNGCVNE